MKCLWEVSGENHPMCQLCWVLGITESAKYLDRLNRFNCLEYLVSTLVLNVCPAYKSKRLPLSRGSLFSHKFRYQVAHSRLGNNEPISLAAPQSASPRAKACKLKNLTFTSLNHLSPRCFQDSPGFEEGRKGAHPYLGGHPCLM